MLSDNFSVVPLFSKVVGFSISKTIYFNDIKNQLKHSGSHPDTIGFRHFPIFVLEVLFASLL